MRPTGRHYFLQPISSVVTDYQLPVNFSGQLKAFLTGSGEWSVPVEMAWSFNSQMLAVTYQGGGLVVLGMNA